MSFLEGEIESNMRPTLLLDGFEPQAHDMIVSDQKPHNVVKQTAKFSSVRL